MSKKQEETVALRVRMKDAMDIPKAEAKRYCRQGKVTVNGTVTKNPERPVTTQDEINVDRGI